VRKIIKLPTIVKLQRIIKSPNVIKILRIFKLPRIYNATITNYEILCKRWISFINTELSRWFFV